MRILLIGNYEPDRQQSMLRFCTLLQCGLEKAGHDVMVIRPEVKVGYFGRTERRFSRWRRYVDKFVLFPARLKKVAQNTDVAHICDQAYAVYTRCLKAVRHVVTCHDLFAVRCALGEFPQFPLRRSGRIYQRIILNGLERAEHVICDSAATRSDVLRLSDVLPSNTSVVHAALNFAYQPATELERRSRLNRLGIVADSRFILHVGAPVPYKNQHGVIRIFQHLRDQFRERDLRLVMVSECLTPSSRKLIEKYSLQSRVRILSCLEPEDLRALYSSAAAFLFPSLHEGFGWPIIEAQACGCPVFVSNRPPMMSEIAGEGAAYIDPENFEKAADTIFKNLPNTTHMREAGFANAERFSLDKMIAGYLKAYSAAT